MPRRLWPMHELTDTSQVAYLHAHRPLKISNGETHMNSCKWALAGATVLLGSVFLSAQVREFTPVTDAMLENPGQDEWLNWRRTQNAWGYSPLSQINRDNV